MSCRDGVRGKWFARDKLQAIRPARTGQDTYMRGVFLIGFVGYDGVGVGETGGSHSQAGVSQHVLAYTC